MAPGQEIPSDDVRACASRLVNLIQVLAFDEPELLQIVERDVRIVVALERRKYLAAQLEALDVEELGAVGIFLQNFKRYGGDAHSA